MLDLLALEFCFALFRVFAHFTSRIVNEFVQVVRHREGQFHQLTIALRCAFEVSVSSALDTALVLANFSVFFHLVPRNRLILSLLARNVIKRQPNFKAALLGVAHLATSEAFHDVLLGTLAGFVTHLVAFEAEFGVALMGLVRVAAAQNAVEPTALIGTLFRHVAKLLTIATLDGGVAVDVVARYLTLHPRKHVVFSVQWLFIVVGFRSVHLLVFVGGSLVVSKAHGLTEVHVAFEGAAWDNDVGVAFCVDG